MKKICIICPPALLIPCVKGSVLEELVTLLVNENEKYKLAEFEIFSVYDQVAFKEGNKYTQIN